ncbi:hypothetical protein G7054_g3283 [Neopestalotiopsis clavispora]|nr:hypothetical protein E8E14_010200 [Neopestalotiopsis sp. 37M]KAF7537981.1 hypothetical protein G7054_g3283 [Neopestalotiopsis clavispora]
MVANKKSEATSLWQRRVKVAMPKADKILETTAWTLLGGVDRKIIRDQIDAFLEIAIAEAVKNLPKGERLDYDPMINQAIQEAFSDHFHLFSWATEQDGENKMMDPWHMDGWEDESCPHELFDMHGV